MLEDLFGPCSIAGVHRIRLSEQGEQQGRANYGKHPAQNLDNERL